MAGVDVHNADFENRVLQAVAVAKMTKRKRYFYFYRFGTL